MSTRRLALIVAGGVLGAFVLVFGSVFLLSVFLLSDPPPDRSEVPLHVLAKDADDGQCALNREDVAAGVHGIDVYTDGSGAAVELRDEAGDAVFRSEGPQGSAYVQTGEGHDALELGDGRYTFVCRFPGGATGEAPLTVTAE